MTNEYSRRELAERLASTPAEVTRISGRLQHWTERGLFTLLGDKHVGRGRARRYPEEALWLAAFFNHCADRGATIGQMAIWGMGVAVKMYRKHAQDAMAGRPVYLMVREPFAAEPETPRRGIEFSDQPKPPSDWEGASVFNLTAIFSRVRR